MRAAAWLAIVLLSACRPSSSPERTYTEAAPSSKWRLRALREREAALRAAYSASEQPAWIDVSGADPYRIVSLDGDRHVSAASYVGILLGSKALVLLDGELQERSRFPLPEAPTALCAVPGKALFVASRLSPVVQRAALGPERVGEPATYWRSDTASIADVACDASERVYALTLQPAKLVTLLRGRPIAEMPAAPGGVRLTLRGNHLLETSLFERSVRIHRLDARGVPGAELARIQHDGPIWAVDAVEHDGTLLIAVAGVEDKPLVRAHGEFENIDSFVWLYRYDQRLERRAELNVGEQGLVVPKSVGLRRDRDEWVVTALAAGSGRLLRAWFSADGILRRAETESTPPGASDAVFGSRGVTYASPLLDAWILSEPQRRLVRLVDPERRPQPNVRLGEALFFTNLMSPENSSAQGHSRFSCETCHFEGGVDGRTHYTGRGDVSVVTKALFGLANNRPHFSRALDPDLSSVSHNEFRVAGAGSGTDPWFSLESARFPWLSDLGLSRGEVSPLDLREALLDFLYAFSHEPNPRALGRAGFDALEADGAKAFAHYCERCHAARVLSDDPRSGTPLVAWEGLILRRNPPLVWARGEYAQTGVLPYVHERGTRITSLRRLALKPRYFTNGSASSLEEVLVRFSEAPGHEHERIGDAPAALDEPTRRALQAFLNLL